MATIDQVTQLLETIAPPQLAEEWDNVGLLVGDRHQRAERVMTCLTLTEDVAQEAVERQANLIVTHHPLPFRPLRRLTTDRPEGRVLWQVIGAGIAVYSPHTALDSAAEGINHQLASGLNLAEAAPLIPAEGADPAVGAGRCGAVLEPTTLAQLATNTARLLKLDHVRVTGDQEQTVARVAVACGSGGALLEAAVDSGADALVTGEATFHTVLAARSTGVAMVLTGHYSSERFALEHLAGWLAQRLPDAVVWASQVECDPVRLIGK